MVVGWVGKSTERPVQYAETAGLDACEVDVPFCFDFVGEGFGKAFDGPCGGAVDFEHRHSERVPVLVGFILRGICEGAQLSLASGRGDL